MSLRAWHLGTLRYCGSGGEASAQELGLSSVREQRIGGLSAKLASGKLFMVLLESESNLDGNHVLAITHLLTCCICFLWCWPSYLAAVFRKWLQTFSTSCFYSKAEIWFGCFVSLLKKLLQLEYHHDCKIMGDFDAFSFKENYFIPAIKGALCPLFYFSCLKLTIEIVRRTKNSAGICNCIAESFQQKK